MDGKVKKYIAIDCESVEEKKKVGISIHNQLKGNKDYIDNNIILNIDEPYTVQLWIFEECEHIPTIQILGET